MTLLIYGSFIIFMTMNPRDFQKSTSGKCIKTPQGFWCFVPNPPPPKIQYDKGIIHKTAEAERMLGELSGTGRILPNPYLLISPYIRREAVASSSIEGTQASLSDLFFFEAEEPDKPRIPDVKKSVIMSEPWNME